MTTYRTKTLPLPGKAFLNSAKQQAQMLSHCIAIASAAVAINSTY